MDTVKEFEKRFEEEILDFLILTKESVGGAAALGDMLKPSLEFTASVDLKTGELSKKKGRLEWLVKKDTNRESSWGFDLKEFEIYHVKVRKCIPVQLEPYMSEILNNRYMLIEVVEENISDPRLDGLKADISRQVLINDNELGTFVLNRRFSWFEGNMDWSGSKCIVYLETDEEDGNTASVSLDILRKLYRSLDKWDADFRAFAAEELTGLANEWLNADAVDDNILPDITKEDFARRIVPCELSISPDGSLVLYFDDDDMFYGHSVTVYADINGGFENANIEG